MTADSLMEFSQLRELALERAIRIRNQIERLFLTLGEHPECELKNNWSSHKHLNTRKVGRRCRGMACNAPEDYRCHEDY
jgi:hypothetical protein